MHPYHHSLQLQDQTAQRLRAMGLHRWILYLGPTLWLAIHPAMAIATSSSPASNNIDPRSAEKTPLSEPTQTASATFDSPEHTLVDSPPSESAEADDSPTSNQRIEELEQTSVSHPYLYVEHITGTSDPPTPFKRFSESEYAYLRTPAILPSEAEPFSTTVSLSPSVFQNVAYHPEPNIELEHQSNISYQADIPEPETHLVSAFSTEAAPVASRTAEVHDEQGSASNEAHSIPPLADEVPLHSSANLLGNPVLNVQGAYIFQEDESSARLRISGNYAFSPNVLVGATVDLTGGDAFVDSADADGGIDLNELYVAVSPEGVPNLRFVAGMIDLTSYFDRNSFAKDVVTHFFHPVFQTNPALSAAGLESSPGLLAYWSIFDNLDVKVATFSSDRHLENFSLDAFAGEVAFRVENVIVRGTYVTSEDAGDRSGFNEIFQFAREDDEFGVVAGDREEAFGLNAEYFIPEINLGLFARYGWYNNLDLDEGGNTYSFGINVLDLFIDDDRLGLAYGRELSNSDRRDEDDPVPDVMELFYDARITPNLRAGVMIQMREAFTETVAGFRIRADFDAGRLFR